MPRFFVSPVTGDTLCIDGENGRHIARSLRMRPGETLTLSDGEGTDYLARILSIDGDAVETEILERTPNQTEPRAKLTLFMAMPKGDKMELIVQKATEIGVSVIQPILTERCISRPDEKSMEKKRARYQKIALEAAGQSGRGKVPEVRKLLTLAETVQVLPEKSILFYEKGGERLSKLITSDDTDIGMFVGSEGGFSEEEAAFLVENGVVPATLGMRILRCETAPLCGMSVILSLTGDI